MSHAGSSASSVKRGQPQRAERPSEMATGSDVSLSAHAHHHPHPHPHGHYDPEWEAKEELRLRELEETRARAAQMEKTMRWWSDCTANWREKWSKVRTERNKAREEARVLRAKLEAAAKECSLLKREKHTLECEIDRLKKDVLVAGDKHQGASEDKGEAGFGCGQSGDWVVAERDVGPPEKPDGLSPPQPGKGFESASSPVEMGTIAQAASQDLEFLDRLLHHKVSGDKDLNGVNSNPSSPAADGKDKKGGAGRGASWKNVELMCPMQEMTEQKLAMLQLRLDEAGKTILAERQEKNKLMKGMEKLQAELTHMRMKYEDIKKSRHDTLKEVLELNQIKSEHQDELDSIRLDLEDEANNRTSLDQRLAELRTELERLQAENAAEWGRRERLETEKLALERENKKLHTQLEDLEDRLDRKSKQITAATDSDVKALQMELHEKSKELSDLKHAHTKLKKVLQDKSTELAHALRRSEQYEAEVKKLRCRIEELKKELAAAEDEVDCATNNIRKLQRTNDDLQEQVESLQVQVEHLQSRLKECPGPSPTPTSPTTPPSPGAAEHEPRDVAPQCQQPDGGGPAPQ